MDKILISTQYGESMYDFDTETQKLTKVLRCFHSDDKVTFDRFSYIYYPKKYREATKEDFNNYDLTCTYYLEDGSRPYKTRDCNNCDICNECNHNQKVL
jgi:hypothetical protein